MHVYGLVKTGIHGPRLKKYLSEADGYNAWTWWPNTEVGHNQEATKEVKDLLGAGDIFDNPKPTRLLKRAIELCASSNDIILDFFSGSCTAAHAVLDLNKDDGGTRRFIVVQLPEPCEGNSEAFKAGYANISDIGKERIRRVIKKIKKERDSQESEGQLPGLAEAQPEIDLGLKVFKLDRSNFKHWDGSDPDASSEKIMKQLELHIDHIDPEAEQEDILYELPIEIRFHAYGEGGKAGTGRENGLFRFRWRHAHLPGG